MRGHFYFFEFCPCVDTFFSIIRKLKTHTTTYATTKMSLPMSALITFANVQPYTPTFTAKAVNRSFFILLNFVHTWTFLLFKFGVPFHPWRRLFPHVCTFVPTKGFEPSYVPTWAKCRGGFLPYFCLCLFNFAHLCEGVLK